MLDLIVLRLCPYPVFFTLRDSAPLFGRGELATTFVKVTNAPSGSVDVLRIVMRAGVERLVLPSEAFVTVTAT